MHQACRSFNFVRFQIAQFLFSMHQAWRRRRRVLVDDLVKAARRKAHACGTRLLSQAQPSEAAGWGEKHDTEVAFQKQKRLRRAVQALHEGALSREEQTHIFGSEQVARLLSEGLQHTEQKQQATYLRRQVRTTASAATRTPPNLAGNRVWLDPAACVTLGPQQIDRCLDARGLVAVPRREEAQCFMTLDVARPGQRVLWNVFLGGGWLLSPTFFIAGQGPLVHYRCALKGQRRCVHFTESFQVQHPVVMGIVLDRLRSTAGCKWSVVPDADSFRARLQPQTKSTYFLVFLTEAEADTKSTNHIDIFRGAKQLTAKTAPMVLGNIIREDSMMGICQR